MQQINNVFSTHRVNIAAQYLQTHQDVGYVVMDIELDDCGSLLDELKAVEGTIRIRVLH
jgi:D-3-phosphoglycerate dehydrogenase